MAVDYNIDPSVLTTQKSKPKKTKVKSPIEREKKPKFSEKYEEELIRQLFDEKKDKSKSVDTTVLQEQKDKIWVHHKRNDAEWDVPIDEEIKYFDSELSYELTGYRPITMEQGLDFDPAPFRESAIKYETTGKYTEFPAGTKSYSEFWKEEHRRCKEGYTVGKYRITGDHYFFLNYYRMQTVVEGAVGASGRDENFPSFLAKQYEFFHYCEMAERLHKDVCLLKARGLGASEMVASLAVRPYTTNPNYTVMISCMSDRLLTPLKTKCWKQLDWLNTNTQGGMRHVRQVVNNNDTKRASKLTKDGVEFGWQSEITAVVADTSDKIRGSRLDRLILDEAGANSKLVESWIKADALVSLGGIHFACRYCLGTGGQDMSINGLADIFLNPEAFNVLPYKNYDSTNGEPELRSFFIPAHKFALSSKYLDNRGVTDYIHFKEYYLEQRKLLKGSKLLDECAEHCFTPEEALSKTGENLFDAELIAARMAQIMIKKDWIEPKKTMLLWDKTADKMYSKVEGHESPNGNILVVEPPVTDENGLTYKNMYVAGIDGIDIGSDESAVDNGSEFCIVIKKRVHGMNEPRYVAMYKERPNDVRKAYENAHKLLVWYNCSAMLEATKIGFQRFLEERSASNLLMARPEYAVSSKNRRMTKKLIGMTTSESVIKHGLELVSNFLNDYWFTIDFTDMLQQLLKYTYSQKTKFDIVASMQMCEAGDEELFGLNPTKVIDTSAIWQDFGYYRDETGHMKHGAIPSNSKYETRWRQ